MMKRVMLLILLGIVWLLACATPLQAQADTDPIYFLHDQILYKWTDAGFEPIGGQMPKRFSYSVSPTGDKLVYQTDSDLAVKTQAAECPCGGGEWPSNLWVVNLSDGYQTLIASQPDNAQNISEETIRSHPLWSPDGNMIAWTESAYHDDVLDSTLVIFNLVTQETKVVAHNLPVPKNSVSILSSLYAWTQMGIMVEKIDYGSPPAHNGFTFYDAFGNIVLDTPSLPEDTNSKSSFLITDANTVSMLIQSKLDWNVLSFIPSQIKTLTKGVLLRYAQGWENTSPRIAPAVMDEGGNLKWEVKSPDGALLTTLTSSTAPLFSLKGHAVLYAQDAAKIDLWRSASDGGAQTIELPWSPDRIIAAADAYWLQPGGSTQVITSTRCEGSNLPFRLFEENGQVLGISANNIRSEPRRDAKLLGQIPGGEFFRVLDGPRCSGGIAWWYVGQAASRAIDGLPGWIAEGTGNTYWLAPYSEAFG